MADPLADPLADPPAERTNPPPARKGRGAVTNRSGRFETHQRVEADDGWSWGSPSTGHGDDALDDPGQDVPGLPPLATIIARDSSRSVIAWNQSPDIPFDRSINPYRGCEHGCVYCFARPTHAWLGLSPGLDFETRLFVKHDAASLLRRELSHRSYRPDILALGSNTDPYQPIERRFKITRQVLEVLWQARHPVMIVTKSDLVLRDLDLLVPMAERRLLRVLISVTTLEPGLARIMEPRAPSPPKRLGAIRKLTEAGVPVGVLAAPMIPALNDDELERILQASADAGAKTAAYVLLRLPLEIEALFEEWLSAHFPDRKEHVLNLLRGTRGGRLYDSTWGQRMTGKGVYAETLRRRFALACKRLALNCNDWQLDRDQFQKPAADPRQLALF